MRFTDLARQFTRHLVQRRGCSLATQDSYDRVYDQFAAYLAVQGEANDVRAFTPARLDGFTTWLAEKGISRNSIRHHLSVFSALAKWAMTQPAPRGKGYLLDENPVARIERPKATPVKEKWLTLDELHAILAVDGAPSDKLALACVVDQPLRASEWCKANVGDLTLVGDQVAIEVTVKGGGRRKKVLGLKLAEALTASLREREARPDEPLLLNASGRRFKRQTFSEVILRLARRAGLGRPVRAHAIRHAIASLAAHNKATVYEIAEMLNHRSLATAQRYIHGVSADKALDAVREAVWR
jgi:site-specific recombinase XerD